MRLYCRLIGVSRVFEYGYIFKSWLHDCKYIRVVPLIWRWVLNPQPFFHPFTSQVMRVYLIIIELDYYGLVQGLFNGHKSSNCDLGSRLCTQRDTTMDHKDHNQSQLPTTNHQPSPTNRYFLYVYTWSSITHMQRHWIFLC